jgi:hypothetical protein
MPYTRRDVLKLGLAGSAAAALLPTGCTGYHGLLQDGEQKRLKFLSVKDYAILLHIADVLLPAGGGYPSHRELGTVLQLDAELSAWEPVRSQEVPVLLRLVEHGTQIFGYSLHRFTRLPAERQREYLMGWGESALNAKRGGFVALKGLLGFYYFSNPKVWPVIGYDGPWQGRFDIPVTEIKGLPA